MKITIESTTKLVAINGVPARIWEGHTEAGVPLHCYITRLGIEKEDAAAFERESDLEEHRAPSPEVEAIPLRLIL
jgi:hypothetical protein